MNVENFEHISIYKDVYPEGYCQLLIDEFNRLERDGAGSNRQQSEGAWHHQKSDHQMLMELRNHNLNTFQGRELNHIFFDGLQKCYDEYSSRYSVLLTTGNIRASVMKMQRTSPGGGYHVWHCEQNAGETASRVVVYMLYLNTIAPEDGAETEFIYQRKRINPVENTMVLWPANYTHAHRGNPVLGDTHKYILTGWFYYD